MSVSLNHRRQSITSPPLNRTGGADGRVDSQVSTPVEQFTHMITELVNPLVARDLLQTLKRAAPFIISRSDSIVARFSLEFLPEDVRQRLEILDAHLRSIGDSADSREITRQYNAFHDKALSFCNEHLPLVESQISALSDELKALYAIREFKMLPNASMLAFEQRLSSADAPEEIVPLTVNLLRPFFASLDSIEQILDSQLTPINPDWTLYSIFHSIIERKINRSENGLSSYRDQPAHFFKRKKVLLKDPESGTLTQRRVMKAQKAGNELTLYLEGEITLNIIDCSSVQHIQTHKHSMWLSLADYNESGAPVTIGLSTSSSISRAHPLVIPGNYNLRYTFYKNHPQFGSCVYVFLDSLGEHTQNCTFRIEGSYEYGGFRRSKVFLTNASDLAARGTLISFAQLDSILTLKKVRKTMAIDGHNIDECIEIHPDSSEHSNQLQHFQEVKRQVDDLSSRLCFNHPKLLDLLLNDLITNRLESINLEIIKGRPFKTELDNLVAEYTHQLHIEMSPEQLLRQIVLKANYRRVITDDNYFSVADKMALLREAAENSRVLQDRGGVLLMGSTGAGKSSASGFLQGANLEEFSNDVGERVFRYKPKAGQSPEELKKYPKIGQAIGESETLYSKGYPVGEDLVIVDCAGDNDTRGSEYEICSKLSFDEAVDRLKAIHAVVAVAPAADFLSSKGNTVLSLIDMVQERFPFAFSRPREGESARVTASRDRVFILITKGNQIHPPEALTNLKNGKRFGVLARELDSTLQRLSQSVEQVSAARLQELHRRKSIWETLYMMSKQKRIHVINFKVPSQRSAFTQAYRGTEAVIDKTLYNRYLDNQFIKGEFGKYVEMSVNAWEDLIFKPLLALPKKIEVCREKVKDYTQEIASVNARMAAIDAQTEKNATKRAQLTTSEEQTSDLSPSMTQNRAKDVEKEIESARASSDQLATSIATLQEKVLALIKEKKALIRDKEKLIEASNDLAIGVHTVELWKTEYKPEDTLKLRYWKSSATRKHVFEANREATDADFTGETRIVKAKHHTGKVTHIVRISKEFRLVPADKRMEAIFKKARNDGNMHITSGKYEAVVRGARFEVDLGMRSDDSGRKVRYGFITKWGKQAQEKADRKSSLPWVEIVHYIPKRAYNEAEITRNNTNVIQLTRDIDEKEMELQATRFEIIQKKRDQKGYPSRISRLSTELQLLKKAATEKVKQKREDLLNTLEEEDVANQKEKEALEASLTAKNAALNLKQGQITEIEKQMRNIAIIVTQEWKTACLLKDFAQRLLTRSGSSTSPVSMRQYHPSDAAGPDTSDATDSHRTSSANGTSEQTSPSRGYAQMLSQVKNKSKKILTSLAKKVLGKSSASASAGGRARSPLEILPDDNGEYDEPTHINRIGTTEGKQSTLDACKSFLKIFDVRSEELLAVSKSLLGSKR